LILAATRSEGGPRAEQLASRKQVAFGLRSRERIEVMLGATLGLDHCGVSGLPECSQG